MNAKMSLTTPLEEWKPIDFKESFQDDMLRYLWYLESRERERERRRRRRRNQEQNKICPNNKTKSIFGRLWGKMLYHKYVPKEAVFVTREIGNDKNCQHYLFLHFSLVSCCSGTV